MHARPIGPGLHCFWLLLLLLHGAAKAQTISDIAAAANAYVLRSSASSDQSESQTLNTKRPNDSNTRIAYVRFDLSLFLNSYPIANITSARLRLYCTGGAADTIKVYGLQDVNAGGVSDSAWTGGMTWNNQPAKTASPNDIPNSSSALPNANTTIQLGSQSFGSIAGEVTVELSLTDLQLFMLDDTNSQITLLFHNTGSNVIGWASNSNTSGFLVPTLELEAEPSTGPAQSLVWDGNVGANWDTATANWKNNIGQSAVYKDGDNLTFDDTKSGSASVLLAALQSPGSILFNNSAAAYALSGSGGISGLTGFSKSGTGTVTVSTANDFIGAVRILAGVLKAGHASALGQAGGGTVISGGATLDINGINLSSEPVVVAGAGVGGNGAIINTGSQQTIALSDVTLTADTTFGGLGRWDIRNSTGSASLSSQGQAYKLTKVGSNQFSLVGVTVDPSLGDIEVREGTFSAETSTNGLGNPARTLTVSSGARLQFYQNSAVLQKNVSLAAGSTIFNSNGDNTFGGPVTLLGSAVIDTSAGTSLTLVGGLHGPGGFIKGGSGALTVSGQSDYTGGTTVNSGTLVVNGDIGGTLTTAAASTLAGSFTNAGAASVSGVLVPGGNHTAGTVTVNGMTLNSGATAVFDFNSNPAVGNGMNDLLQVNGNLALNNNTITIDLLAPPQANIAYRLVSYTGALTGTFNPVLNIDSQLLAAHLDYSTPGAIDLIFDYVGTFTIPFRYPVGPGPINITPGPDGKLIYHPDSSGDIIPDFSSAGYKGSAVPIPDVPTVVSLSPVVGDNYPQIQNAINTLTASPLNAEGFRGAIQLAAGVYEMSSGLVINAGGIVLRGAGDGPDGTILRRVVSGGDIIEIRNGSGGRSEVSGTRKELTDAYVPLGAKWFRVENTAGLAAGDEVVIVRRSTSAWLDDINQSNWSAGSFDVQMQRTITAIEANRVMVDSPLIQSIDRSHGYGGGYMYKYTWPGLTQNVGVEDIRADCTVDVDPDNNTGGQFMEIIGALNCWVRRCTNDRMKGHTMKITSSAKWITVQDIVSFHYRQLSDTSSANIQIHTFDSSAQGLLFHRITASHGGFEWSSGTMGSGPTVFAECTVPAAYAFSGPHMKWACGVLYDSLWMNQGLSVLKHDGSHGFGGANHIAWNCQSSGYHFDRPPTAHQWNVGCIGLVDSDEPRNGALPCERLSHGTHVQPGSLLRAQLAQRIGAEQALAVLGHPDGTNPFELVGSSVSVQAGGNANVPVVMSVPPDYAGQTVTFGLGGLPAGVSGALSSNTSNAAATVLLNLAVNSSVRAGSYPLTVTGSGTFPVRGGGSALITRTATVTLDVRLPGDIDGDGLVRLEDFSCLSSQWLSDRSAVPSADIWPADGGDGTVDMHELLVLVEHFLESQ